MKEKIKSNKLKEKNTMRPIITTLFVCLFLVSSALADQCLDPYCVICPDCQAACVGGHNPCSHGCIFIDGRCLLYCAVTGTCASVGGGEIAKADTQLAATAKPKRVCTPAQHSEKTGKPLRADFPWLNGGEMQDGKDMLEKTTNADFRGLLQAGMLQILKDGPYDSTNVNMQDSADNHMVLLILVDFKTHVMTLQFYVDNARPSRTWYEYKALNPDPVETLRITPTDWTWTRGTEEVSGKVK